MKNSEQIDRLLCNRQFCCTMTQDERQMLRASRNPISSKMKHTNRILQLPLNTIITTQSTSQQLISKSMLKRRRRRQSLELSIASSCVLLALLVLATRSIADDTSSAATSSGSNAARSALRFDPISSGYSGLTFSFDPRLDKRVEQLHFEHWLAIMQQTSSLMHESLSGRAHLASIQVLIPYRWRHNKWPVLHKPGVPIMSNRLVKYAHSDVIVGFEDPIYRETPFAIQHDECAMQGHNIHMPISFLEDKLQPQELDTRLKARLLLREFASHRYGLFKESGFRADPMYPPFNALPGHQSASSKQHKQQQRAFQVQLDGHPNQTAAGAQSTAAHLRGFDPKWNECSFDTQPANGMPASHALQCAPYLVRSTEQPTNQLEPSFNLMGADPFSHVSLASAVNQFGANSSPPGQLLAAPVEWADLVEQSPRWYFCGEPFSSSSTLTSHKQASSRLHQLHQDQNQNQLRQHKPHNPLALNKQNIMCNERAAMDIIRLSDDFKRANPSSGSQFNRLPDTSFQFVQEMPPRVVLGVEYSAHLYQARRLEHGILEAAIGKWLTYDLIADSEFGLVLFGQSHSHRYPFKKLDSSLDARPALYSPPIDPFDEAPRLYTEHELLQQFNINLATTSNGQQQQQAAPAIVKGTCSFARLLAEAQHLASQGNKYDDQGVDYVLITSGLFVESVTQLEDLLKDFKSSQVQLNIIIYPSSMLFDTKSYPSQFVVLDQKQSDAIVASRINKLLVIKRLTGAKIHLVKEHVDANNDVRMSTLLQFYQIFQHISSGHSWDQTSSMIMLNQQQVVEATRDNQNNNNNNNRQQHQQQAINGNQQQQYRLQFQFQLDNSLENELIVGFIDPKSQSFKRQSGKRFSLRNLQLRSPTGQLVLTDPTTASLLAGGNTSSSEQHLGSLEQANPSLSGVTIEEQLIADQEETLRATNTITDSALFPYRQQLGLAGFHLRSAHLLSAIGATNNNNTASGTGGQARRSPGASGLWTLSAISEEPLQTSAIAMARVNPAGDSVTASCWLQTYDQVSDIFDTPTTPSSKQTSNKHRSNDASSRMVKLFVQLKGAPGSTPPLDTYARMEVEDESGNIVQNVNMLDDGLGVPDMTRNDGIHTQYVQPRLQAPGFYRVRVEISGSSAHHHQATTTTTTTNPMGHRSVKHSVGNKPADGSSSIIGNGQWQPQARESSPAASGGAGAGTGFAAGGVGQDTPCCGSFMPASVGAMSQQQQQQTRHLSRQLYCGTFYLEPNTVLGPQQPPRINTLSVQSVDQESRRVTLRWQEPQVDINAASGADFANNAIDTPSGGGRYEIKIFANREAAKRAFDAKQEVGYLVNEQLLDAGQPMPNVSAYGGSKELALRIPYAREGIYYIAMKVYDQVGHDSPLSNIVQFWIRANQTQLDLEMLDASSTTMDADGNVYDKNGELVHQRASSANGSPWNQLASGQQNQHSSGMGQLMGSIDGLSMLVLLSLCAFLFSLLCISLVACFATTSPRNHHHKKSSSTTHLKRKSGGSSSTTSSDKPAMILASNGSSLASSSQCASSQQSELASSNSVQSDPCDPMDPAKTIENLMSEHESKYSNSHHHMISHHEHQQQEHMIQNWQQLNNDSTAVIMSGEQLYQRQQHHLNQQQLIQHNMINGYAYATVNQQQQLNQNNMNYDVVQNDYAISSDQQQQQSWTTDVLQNHYDKVKQARERNENPPVLRVSESLDPSQSQGLPIVQEVVESSSSHKLDQSSYLLRRPSSRGPGQHHVLSSQQQVPIGLAGMSANPQLNQQLQQQLSSVLRSKRLSMSYDQDNQINMDPNHSSPALEGLTDQLSDLGTPKGTGQSVVAIDRLVIPPPPPHYAYEANSESMLNGNGLAVVSSQQAMLTEPSIYSQLTNLQQQYHQPNQNNNDDPNQYYANQWNYNAQQKQLHEQNNNNLDQISPMSNQGHQYHSLEQATISDV